MGIGYFKADNTFIQNCSMWNRFYGILYWTIFKTLLPDGSINKIERETIIKN